ncbi:MAG: hypothetical protein JXK07_03345 [Spirochaetes bacterium]|nr:hypothetical protein [Spirochaetota bacterium]MBN2769327.1 hypothetical protein [Spirochaetota bacterium]
MKIVHILKNFPALRLFCLVILLFFCLPALLLSEDFEKDFRLTTVKKDFETYKDKDVSFVLRLQYCDLNYNEISFYDMENINLRFSIKDYQENPVLKRKLRNISRGLYYRVKCKLIKMDEDGTISADLIDFTPYRLEQLP